MSSGYSLDEAIAIQNAADAAPTDHTAAAMVGIAIVVFVIVGTVLATTERRDREATIAHGLRWAFSSAAILSILLILRDEPVWFRVRPDWAAGLDMIALELLNGDVGVIIAALALIYGVYRTTRGLLGSRQGLEVKDA